MPGVNHLQCLIFMFIFWYWQVNTEWAAAQASSCMVCKPISILPWVKKTLLEEEERKEYWYETKIHFTVPDVSGQRRNCHLTDQTVWLGDLSTWQASVYYPLLTLLVRLQSLLFSDGSKLQNKIQINVNPVLDGLWI